MPEQAPTVAQTENSDDPSRATSKTWAAANTPRKQSKAKPAAKGKAKTRTRKARPYPAYSFEQALPLIDAIWKFGAGDRIRRLTLLKELDKSPTSSTVQNLITNSTKYGLTTGSYVADWLVPTEEGKKASDPAASDSEKLQARFHLAVERIPPFKLLYAEYKGKKLPSHEVMKDVLRQSKLQIEDQSECLDTFIVNVKFLGLLQTIAGAETLLPIENVLDLPPEAPSAPKPAGELPKPPAGAASASKTKWSQVCFYIAPIGEEASEERKHSDLFLGSLIEPALKEFDLEVVRADAIGEAGMISSQVLEHIMRSRLAIVDLSFHNPNAFYEMAVRHCCRLPVIQITRKQDRLPFDVNQVRTIVIDTSDIYSLVPKLETYRSEIASQVRAVLADHSPASNPISVFFPQFQPIGLKSGAAQSQ
jgi:hypothetical protein